MCDTSDRLAVTLRPDLTSCDPAPAEVRQPDSGCDPVALLASQMETAVRPRHSSAASGSEEATDGSAGGRTPRLSETSEAASDASDQAAAEVS